MQNIGSIPQNTPSIPMNSVKKPQTDRSKEILELLEESIPMLKSIFSIQLKSSDKALNSILETLKDANDQRDESNKLASEKLAEDAKEKSLKEEKQAEITEKQNAEIISKLSTLNDTMKNLEISGDSDDGKGIFDYVMDLFKSPLLGKLLGLGIAALSALGGALISLIGGIITSAPFLLLAAGAIGYLIGDQLYDKFLKPYQEKILEDANKSLEKVNTATTQEQVTTNTGEKVFEKTDETGNVSYVTESEMKTATPEEGVSYQPATNVIDIHSGMYAGRTVLPSGKTIEEINEAAKAVYEEDKNLSEEQKASRDFAKEITNFDESFRDRLAMTMTQWENQGGWSASNAVLGGREAFKSVLENLHGEHLSIIKRLRSDNRLSDQTKEQLTEMSPLFKESLKEDPDVDTLFGLGYDLPSGQGLTFDWGNSKPLYEENRKIIDTEFGRPSGRADALKKKYSAKQALEKQEQSEVDGIIQSQIQSMETPPMAATGAVVYPKTSKGVLTNISEDMKPEAVVPLDEYDIMKKQDNIIQPVDNSEDITNIIRDTYFDEKDASRESNQPIVINNVSNNNSGGGGGDQGVNFQYQTDLTKTFDSVFEMILEKNMKIAIT
jgi:hypothetical protein